MPVKKSTNSKIKTPYISLVLPVYNEEENIVPQYKIIIGAIKDLKKTYEIIFIDDGSTDSSYEIIMNIAKADKNVKGIRFRRNFGQTAAMAAGIDYAEGEVIIFMDSDMQNDPQDITSLLDKIDEGYDVVSGWRKSRQDKLISRKIPSRIANKIISKVSGVPLHDLGCSLKAYRSEIIKQIRLYGEMHRFIPIHTSWVGAKITEIPVRHHARVHGKSKYGIKRTFKVILDLITVKFMGSYSTKPLYLYGGVAMLSFFMSFVSLSSVIFMKYYLNLNMTGNPLLLLSTILFVIGVLLVLMGIQAEILIRILHETDGKYPYYVKEKINVK